MVTHFLHLKALQAPSSVSSYKHIMYSIL